ncbi:SDR family oxidoreductase [Streptacidiphilus jiangxiensis]|uniref:3-oxoacyl-[acyl-carrier protein] reductase n=1 Tax=Streptacidiphilus jiangxiensis TaxID=235985 RepID=A0A1H7VR58_STRJI|nr:SDR family oxidoreductase [Streptacidiphilus jiangxiensis]SEM11369.1 3-oxoacyl-[acyl-carrier protein] reductase [Streptacidiphilus jiangxiensis]
MDLGLAGRVYIVTAATRGLGFASARELAAEGAHLVITGREKESVAEAVDALGGPERVEGVVADNAAPDTAERLVGAALSRFGRLDGLLVSVGGPAAGTALATPESAWRDAFESVFLGALRLARAAADVLTEGGAIGFVLSGSAREPIAGLAVSNGLRPGLAMTAKTLAAELGPEGIRVFGLLPARIDTERVQHLDGLSADPAATRAAHEASIPLRRYGRPEEFGRVAAFTLSPAASYLTGVMIPVDGGALHGI